MPDSHSSPSAAAGSPANGILELLRRVASLQEKPPAAGPKLDPQEARQALAKILKLLTDETDTGAAARDALHRLARAARDLLQLVGGHEL